MKVYVITSGQYSDYGIEAVALDEKEAQLKCALLNSQREFISDFCNIEEYDTEYMQVSTNEELKLKFIMHVYYASGEIISLTDEFFTIGENDDITVFINYERKKVIKCKAILPLGTTRDEAKKIMLDRIAEIKAKEAGI